MSDEGGRIDGKAVDVNVDSRLLRVTLVDGREVSVPLEWYPRLRDASAEQQENWELSGRGQAIHWPEVEEDIRVSRMMRVR